MPSSDLQRKPSKGSVRIKSSNDRLQLVFSVQGRRHYLSLGLPDTQISWKVTEAKARQGSRRLRGYNEPSESSS